jgi:hypothetical protein
MCCDDTTCHLLLEIGPSFQIKVEEHSISRMIGSCEGARVVGRAFGEQNKGRYEHKRFRSAHFASLLKAEAVDGFN